MIRTCLCWLMMGLLVAAAHAQTVTVRETGSNEPVPHAAIYSMHAGKVISTDASGQVSLEQLAGLDTLHVRMVGYLPAAISMEEVRASDYTLWLKPSPILLSEVVVSAYQKESMRQSSLQIQALELAQLQERGTHSLTDILSTIPGVSSLGTGPGISKPVIRGLYGNRILVLFSGLRFDNQQWQDEHGLGLADIGISRVEVIKGPFSLLYGTEALGGLINIMEERAPVPMTLEADAGIKVHSNTAGGTVQAGIKANRGNRWYRLRLASTSHADYSDGKGDRVLNSRFKGQYFKGSYGFQKGRWMSENHYHLSYNKFGFIFNDLEGFFEADERWSRQMTGPHHIVLLNMFTSLNEIELASSRLELNAGIQSNLRQEDEGGAELSLQMHLLTGQYALRWTKALNSRWSTTLANSSSYERNTNYGRRKIVPDAHIAESTLSGYLKHRGDKLTLEWGGGGGFRQISTLLTPTVNSAEKEIDPFSQLRLFANGMMGASFSPAEAWNLKLNLATGVRAPNLAELSANGLHEGIYTYELGDPDMDNERNINADAELSYTGSQASFSLSGFYNHFDGYIYLEPTGEEWFGFPVYRFRQHDARIYGAESSLSIHPSRLPGWSLSATWSGLVGELDKDNYLPWMPAQQLKPEIRYEQKDRDKPAFYGFANAALVFSKQQVNAEEQSSPAYQLINAGMGYRFHKGQAAYTLGLAANNLLNAAYFDHLSRLKNFGQLNMGRNVTLNLKINLSQTLKTKN